MKRLETVVLIVDDDAGVRNFLRHLMQQSGYAVLVAANGREGLALSRAFSGEIQLLMSDINMPHMDGLDLASHVINDRPGTRRRIIDLSRSAAAELGILKQGVAIVTLSAL